MLFQALDTKKECAGIYTSGDIVRDHIPSGLSATWKYTPHLDLPVEYANLYCCGKSIAEVCPSHKQEEWTKLNAKLHNYIKACDTAKVDLDQNCFYDLVPQNFLLEYCEIRNQITEHVLNNYEKPENYDFLLDLVKMLGHIKTLPLNIDARALKNLMALPRARRLYKKLIKKGAHRVDYLAFKSKTGRLTTSKNSFPILTLDKGFRSVVKPTNDYFLELDFNAAELRTLLALSGKAQPDIDIHEWNIKNIYRGALTRDAAKKRIFAWLYNPNSKDFLSDRAYERDEVLREHFDGKCVKTVFNRTIVADKHHALNYIIQSTTSDLLLKRAIEVGKILQGRKSNISFLLHDSLVVDFAKEDADLLEKMVITFGNTDLGRYVVNASVGKDFGNMARWR